MSRAKGTRKPCDMRPARLRLVDARQFLEAAELLDAPDGSLATALRRALDRKTQAGYESVDVSRTDASSCVRWARKLLVAAEARFDA